MFVLLDYYISPMDNLCTEFHHYDQFGHCIFLSHNLYKMICCLGLGIFLEDKVNSGIGIYASNQGTIHLHGEATAIHSNVNTGIYANGSSKVLIHLPSHHNTIYNNTGHDRFTFWILGL